HGELEREAACLEHAALDRLGQAGQVQVAVHELAPGVADPDHGPAAERLVAEALRLQPGPVQEAVQVPSLEPLGAAATVRVAVAVPVTHRRHLAPPSRRV